jgi:uncharacterized protein (TIGR02246 family)
MLRALFLAALVLLGLAAPAARAGTADDVRRLYAAFAAAQNARDLAKVESLLLDSPRFLWVSDGLSIWGRRATLKRMALFQENQVWRVEPDLERAVAVVLTPDTAYYHLPLTLAIGPGGAAPERLRFLVSMLCLKTKKGWRIAALFTTTEHPPM